MEQWAKKRYYPPFLQKKHHFLPGLTHHFLQNYGESVRTTMILWAWRNEAGAKVPLKNEEMNVAVFKASTSHSWFSFWGDHSVNRRVTFLQWLAYFPKFADHRVLVVPKDASCPFHRGRSLHVSPRSLGGGFIPGSDLPGFARWLEDSYVQLVGGLVVINFIFPCIGNF